MYEFFGYWILFFIKVGLAMGFGALVFAIAENPKEWFK